MREPGVEPLRLLVVAESWMGGNGRGFSAALGRAGHRVTHIDPLAFVPNGWASPDLRVVGKVMRGRMIRDLTRRLLREIESRRHDAFVAYKGQWVAAEVPMSARRHAMPAVNIYPDNSVDAHGRTLAEAIGRYDVVFSTKRFHLDDLRERGVPEVVYLPHGFDPEVHRPPALTVGDDQRYGCDVSFIGTWSPKKQALLETLVASRPDLRVRIWGEQWEKAPSLRSVWEGRGALGWEYAVAVACSRVNLALLSEARAGASSDDMITARTFEIPGIGGLMLHERTDDLSEWFVDGHEVATFQGADELLARLDELVADEDLCAAVAERGRARVRAGASLDHRAEVVGGWLESRLGRSTHTAGSR